MTKLSMNNTHLKSLENMPEAKLEKLEVSDNHLKNDELSRLTSLYASSLVSLKAANNKIDDLEAVITFVKSMPHLEILDLSNNSVAEKDGYRDKIFENCSSLKVLDGMTKDGEEVEVSSDENEDYGEEGEDDMDGELDAEILNKLDPEMRQKFEDGELNSQDLAALGFGAIGEEGEIEQDEGDYGEEGEAEGDDDDGEDE